MIVPAHDPEAIARHAQFTPDVVVLDLEYSVPPRCRDRARAELGNHIKTIGDAQKTCFVRIDRDARWADVRAAIHRGITGIVYPGPEDAAEIMEIAALIDDMEKVRGVEPGVTEIVLMLESARGFWNAAELAQASARIAAIGVGRIDLTMQLGPVPQNEFRLYRFLLTRTLLAARMLGKQPLGAHFRPGSRGGVTDARQTLAAAKEARLMGFRGAMCAIPEQVAAVNDGFSLG
jgi:citrate lyase subunit beta/citryl-CoA lyase